MCTNHGRRVSLNNFPIESIVKFRDAQYCWGVPSDLPGADKLLRVALEVCEAAQKPMKARDMAREVAIRVNLDLTSRPIRSERDKRTDLEYKLAWTRTSAAQLGYLVRSKEGWCITDSGANFLRG